MGHPGESGLLEWPVSLLDYEKRFATLRVNRGGANKSPHKVAMLQAVMDLVASGEVTNNRFYFDDDLKRHFTERFQALASPSDRNNPHLPFFHLRSEGFGTTKSDPASKSPMTN
jgi:predicted restriction endonuclease